MSYDTAAYFRDYRSTARRLLILLSRDHPQVLAAVNTSSAPVPFNPVYAWFMGNAEIPEGDPS
jgi:hypothetical protein